MTVCIIFQMKRQNTLSTNLRPITVVYLVTKLMYLKNTLYIIVCYCCSNLEKKLKYVSLVIRNHESIKIRTLKHKVQKERPEINRRKI